MTPTSDKLPKEGLCTLELLLSGNCKSYVANNKYYQLLVTVLPL